MPLELTNTSKALLEQDLVEQLIILEIDGIDDIFSNGSVTTDATYGQGLIYGGGASYGGLSTGANVRSLISPTGTTYNITQQLRVDQAQVSSIQKIAVNLVDESESLTFTFSPGFVVDDILGRDALVYIGFKGGEHPKDSVVILNGKIDQVDFAAGNITLQIANPIDLARTRIYEKISTELTADFLIGSATMDVIDTEGILLPIAPDTTLESYVRINDEIMLISSLFGGTQITVTRAQFGTIEADHESGDNVETVYRLQGNTTDLALKLLLSNPSVPNYVMNQAIESFVQTGSTTNANAVFIPVVNGIDTQGYTIGDCVNITGATNAANNVVDGIIQSVTQDEGGTIIILADTNLNGDPVSLILENPTGATLDVRSKFNVLPHESELFPKHVDIAQFQLIEDQFGAGFFDYDFMLSDTIDNLRDFISNEIYKPSGAFSLPRKGRVSIGYSRPPLNDTTTKTLNSSNVKNADKIKVTRTTNKNFFNAVSYDFEESRVDPGRFLNNITTISADSISRISTRNKVLEVDALGIRNTTANQTLINRQIRRFLDRFQFGAETLRVETLYKTGFSIEIGDSVVLDGSNLFISDTKTGSRNFQTRVLEVINKKQNIKTGDIEFELLDANFGSNVRFGVVSQASFIDSGATTTTIPVKRSFGTESFELESDKYLDYIGQRFKVRSRDYTFNEEVTLVSIPSDNTLQITALSAPPSEDFLIECPDYGTDANPQVKSLFKGVHCFFTPRVFVVNGVSDTQFEVAPADIALFSLNQPIEVHNDDYSNTSNAGSVGSEPIVTDINTGTNIITVSSSLGFTPSVGDSVELIGFATDGGAPYAFV